MSHSEFGFQLNRSKVMLYGLFEIAPRQIDVSEV